MEWTHPLVRRARNVHQEEGEAPFPNGIEVPEWSF